MARPALGPGVLGDHHGAVLGMCDDGPDEVLCYDALADEELSTRLLSSRDRRLRERTTACASSSRSSATPRSSTTSACS